METTVVNAGVLAQHLTPLSTASYTKRSRRAKRHVVESTARSKDEKDTGSVPASVTDLLPNLGCFALLLFFLCLFGLLWTLWRRSSCLLRDCVAPSAVAIWQLVTIAGRAIG